VHTLRIAETKSGRKTDTLHTFYQMGDGSCVAFFDAPDMPFAFKPQLDFDLHLALEVDEPTLHRMFEKGKAAGIETRGISDHGFIHSIYFRDPNGYVVELTAKVGGGNYDLNAARATARKQLDGWQTGKQDAVVKT
jgi:catechol-2,3-dioxygenase